VLSEVKGEKLGTKKNNLPQLSDDTKVLSIMTMYNDYVAGTSCPESWPEEQVFYECALKIINLLVNDNIL